MRAIAGRSASRWDCEAAGLLLGHRQADRFIVMRATQSAGTGTRYGFNFDSECDLEAAAEVCEREGFEILGCWHSELQRVSYPFPAVTSMLSEPDLTAAASWREHLGGAPTLFVLMVRDQASRWQCLPSYRLGPDYLGRPYRHPAEQSLALKCPRPGPPGGVAAEPRSTSRIRDSGTWTGR